MRSIKALFFVFLIGMAACTKQLPPAPSSPVYTQESFESLDLFIEEFRREFFEQIKKAETEDVFRGVHPELSKARNKVTALFENRPEPKAENWRQVIQQQKEVGDQLVSLAQRLALHEDFSPALQKRMQLFHRSISEQWRLELHRYGLNGELI